MGVSTAVEFPAHSGLPRRLRPLVLAVPLLWVLAFVAVYAVGSRSHGALAPRSGVAPGTVLSAAQSASLLGTGVAAPAVQGVSAAPAPPALAAVSHPKPHAKPAAAKPAAARPVAAAPVVVTRPASTAPRVITRVVIRPVISTPLRTPVVRTPVTPVVSHPAPVSSGPASGDAGSGSGTGIVTGGG